MSTRQTKMFVFVTLALMALVGSLQAGTIYWDGPVTSEPTEACLWGIPANWDGDSAPISTDSAFIAKDGAHALIVDGDDITVDYLQVGKFNNTTCYLDMTGGTLAADRLYPAYGNYGSAIRVVTNFSGDAVFTTSYTLENRYGLWELNISDNATLTTPSFWAARYGGHAAIHLYGGSLNLTTETAAFFVSEGGTGTMVMNITEGQLTQVGNHISEYQTLAANGQIIAYGGLGEVVVSYDATAYLTTVTAVPEANPLFASHFFSEKFYSDNLGVNLQQMDKDGTGLLIQDGKVIGNNSFRRYVATVMSDYNLYDWVFELDFKHTEMTGAAMSYIGYGSALRNASYYDSTQDYSNICFSFGESSDGGIIVRSPDGKNNYTDEGVFADSVHRVQILKQGEMLYLRVDKDYDGQDFEIDFEQIIDTTRFGFSSESSRLFCGTQTSSTSFDNFSIRRLEASDLPSEVVVDNFDNNVLGVYLQNMDNDDNVMIVEDGRVRGKWGFRRYVATKRTDLMDYDWIYDIDVEVNALNGVGLAFVGFGSAIRDPDYYDVPLREDNIYIRFSDDASSGYARVCTPTGDVNQNSGNGVGIGQTNHVRLTKTANILTVELDAGYDGVFVPDFSKTIDLDAFNLSEAENRLFFGTYSHVTYFDNFNLKILANSENFALKSDIDNNSVVDIDDLKLLSLKWLEQNSNDDP